MMKSFLLSLFSFVLLSSTLLAQSERPKSLSTSPVFDAAYYAERYSDVTKENALKHWTSVGLDEGRAGSAVFDASYYLKMNKDVIKSIRDDKDYAGAALHWLEYGIQEGRPSHPDFNIKYYVKNNQDLYKSYGMDFQRLIEHYLNQGRAAGLKATP
jgi:hypothetical protein